MVTALVYGWYGRGNAGDELMKQALVSMFKPRGFELSFVDRIDVPQLLDYSKPGDQVIDAVIFGGGSILYGAPDVTPAALQLMLSDKVPVFYLGVGGETQVHPVHQQLLKVARVVAYRERDIPDLVFSLPTPDLEIDHQSDGLLVIPNVETVPSWEDAHWKHVAWEHYKNEFSQAIDQLVDNGLNVSYLLMCSNPQMEDAWATSELIARMKRRPKVRPVYVGMGMGIVSTMRRHKAVVTQRYHGIILAEAAGVPYVSIDHHDKLKNATPSRGVHVPYYGATKASLISSIESALKMTLEPHRVPRQVYDDLVDTIVDVVARKQ